MQEQNDDSFENLPQEHKDFLTHLRAHALTKLNDGQLRDKLINLTQTIKNPEEKLNFFTLIPTPTEDHPKTRFYLVSEFVALGTQLEQLQNYDAAAEAYVLGGALSFYGTPSSEQAASRLEHMLDAKKLDAFNTMRSLEFVAEETDDPEKMQKYSNLWAQEYEKTNNIEDPYDRLMKVLSEDTTYAPGIINYLNQHMRQLIGKNPAHDKACDLVCLMLDHMEGDTKEEAELCLLYHVLSTRQSKDNEEFLDYSVLKESFHTETTEFSYSEALYNLYSNLETISTLWDVNADYNKKEKLKLQKDADRILKMDKQNQKMALLECAEKALAHENNDNSHDSIKQATLIRNVISQLPASSNTESTDPKTSFLNLMQERMHITSLFTDADGQASSVSCYMKNKMQLYVDIRKSTNFDLSAVSNLKSENTDDEEQYSLLEEYREYYTDAASRPKRLKKIMKHLATDINHLSRPN